MTANTFRLHLSTDSDAFTDSPAREVARILREVASHLEDGSDDFSAYRTLFDVNGNDVGRAAFKPADPVPEPTRRRRGVTPSRPRF